MELGYLSTIEFLIKEVWHLATEQSVFVFVNKQRWSWLGVFSQSIKPAMFQITDSKETSPNPLVFSRN